jgi:hypothetical protein
VYPVNLNTQSKERKMLSVTQVGTNKEISIYPEVFIVHQPRRIQLELPGKRAFKRTTLMSIFNPLCLLQINESYENLSRELIHEHRGFSEFTHGQTGTKFLVSPKYFILVNSGFDSGFLKQVEEKQVPELTESVSMISVMNSGVWVPIKGTYEEAKGFYNYGMRDV